MGHVPHPLAAVEQKQNSLDGFQDVLLESGSRQVLNPDLTGLFVPFSARQRFRVEAFAWSGQSRRY